MLLSEGFWMLSDASAAPASCLLPPCPFLVPSYEPALQSISSPAVSITIQLGEEELPVSSICPSLPRALIGQRQLCPSPGVSLLSGSSAGSHWLSRRARERPLGTGSVRRGSRQRSAAPAARAAPQESAASAGAVRAAASRKPRHNGSEC